MFDLRIGVLIVALRNSHLHSMCLTVYYMIAVEPFFTRIQLQNDTNYKFRTDAYTRAGNDYIYDILVNK